MRDVVVPGAEGLALHHLYRTMRWLGEAKDEVEEALFAGRRDLFTELSLTLFDTTSLYFEGMGGEGPGQHGHSKDHRPDLRQMVTGVLTGDGSPVCCELWPGNHADGTALLPVVDRLRQSLGLTQVCWVADRRMISRGTIQALDDRSLEYILGARMRRQREVCEAVLGRAGRYHEVAEDLRVKEVSVDGHRYIICHNPQEAARDAEEWDAIVKALEDEIKQGVRQLVGNRGISAVPAGGEGRGHRRPEEGSRRGPLRRQVRAQDQYLATGRRGGGAVQAPVAGGAVLSGDQVTLAHQAHLPSGGRYHQGPCVLLLSGPGACG